jgi:hypothetical protein
MVAPIRTMSFLETKMFPLDMGALIPVGALITSVQMTASRTDPFPLQTASLFATAAIGSTTMQVSAAVNPGVGALLILEPGLGAEEKFKVIAIAGASSPWTLTLDHASFVQHTSGAGISYEPGMNTRLLVDDTPPFSGTVVNAVLRKGAHAQKYRVSYLAACNNGTAHEDEFLLEVLDKASTNSEDKQPYEIVDIAADFEKLLEEPHHSAATLSTAVAYVSSALPLTPNAQLAAAATPGNTTITLNAHPGIGAMLILTPAGTGNNPPERVYTTNVTGAGPTYTVTILPDLEFTHSNGADVQVYQGFNTTFLTQTASTSIVGKAVFHRAQRGQAGKSLKVVWLATTSVIPAISQAEVLSTTGLITLEET